MAAAIKKQFRIQWKDWIIMSLLIVGASIFGVVLFAVIGAFDAETVSYFPLGTVMGGITALMFCMILMITNLNLSFNIEVAMGCTRKQFFVSSYITSFAAALIAIALVILVDLAERAVYPQIYPHLEEEIDFLPYLLKWSIPAAAAVPVFGGFFGALMMKFGRTAFWILWALWMVLCLGFPNIHEAIEEAPNSMLGKIGIAAADVFGGVPVSAWIMLGAAAAVVSLVGSWMIVRRQQVTA